MLRRNGSGTVDAPFIERILQAKTAFCLEGQQWRTPYAPAQRTRHYYERT